MTEHKIRKPWYGRWWAITLFIFLGLVTLGNLFSDKPKDIYYCSDGREVSNPDICLIPPTNIQRETISQPTTKQTSVTTVSETDQLESRKINLTVIDLSCKYGEYDWIYVKGRVKNNDLNREASYVKVSIDLYNNDEWVESDFTYIRNTDLSAGDIDSFEKTWTDDSIKFTRCEAFVTYND